MNSHTINTSRDTRSYKRTTSSVTRKAGWMTGRGAKVGAPLDSEMMIQRICDEMLLSAIATAGRFVTLQQYAPARIVKGVASGIAAYWYQAYRDKYDALTWLFIPNLCTARISFEVACDYRDLNYRAAREGIARQIAAEAVKRGELDEIESRILRAAKPGGPLGVLQKALAGAIREEEQRNPGRIRTHQDNHSDPVRIRATKGEIN